MKKSASSNVLKKMLKYVGRHKLLLFLSVALAGITVALTLYIPIIVGDTVDFIVGEGDVDIASVAQKLALIGAVALITAILQWIMNSINNRLTFRVVMDVRNSAFEKIEHLPLSFIDSHPHGDIVSRVISDADQFGDGLLLGISQLFSGVLTIVLTLVFMLTINPAITAVVVVLTPLSLFMAKFIAGRTFKTFKKQSETRAEMTSHINETFSGQKTVKSFCREKAVTEEFDDINDRLKKTSLSAVFFSSLTNPCTRFVNAIVYAAVVLIGALFVISSGGASLTVGSLTSLLAYANQYTKPFNEISNVVTEFQNAIACAQRLFSFIEEESESGDDDARELEAAKGRIDVENMCFSYTNDKPLIENLNIHVSPGQRVAIVGPTGCGKTTIINLLMRFYDPDSGCIKVDGENTLDITRKSLRQSYGMVLQDTWIKNGTVHENIAMGRDVTREEVIAAAKKAHAHSFIKRLPNGYDTVIGNESDSFSQGQKQLLCISRIMLRLPPILILDEATSSIDTRTEIKIQNAFALMMKGRTSFIIAHRLSTIKAADIILVMRDGKIIEQGTHEQLLADGGFYKELWNSQFE